MTIRCPECGYENRDMYRFCGMCGATLRREPVSAPEPPAVVAEPAPERIEPPSAPVQTTTAPPPSLDYLLEEEPPKSRGKLYLTLALLVIAAGVIAWQWESDQRTSAEPAATSTPAASTSQAPVPAATSSTPASAKSEETPTPKESPKTVAPPLVVTQETAPATKPTEEADTKPQEQDATPAASGDAASDSSTTADASQPAVAPPTPAPKPKPDPKIATPPAPVLKGDDKLVADGEKYLYGNGVPEDCDLAQKNLKAAAAHSNARALTLMGAMYATGHCVDRDLPTAYRWFAKALHQDPSNARVQQDLEILWRQMTPGERQLATKTGG
jgi:hypothetical protein